MTNDLSHEDPFSLHLLGERPRVADAPDDNRSDSSQIEADLERLIENADWAKLRPKAFAEASQAPRDKAKERREGELPDLTGMGSIKSLDRAAGAMKTIQAQWSSLAVEDRVAQLKQAIDEALITASVPPLAEIFLWPGKKYPASFDFRTWRLLVRAEFFQSGQLDDVAAADLMSLLVHESRHAEQQFLAARVLAAKGASAAKIAASLDGLHPPIAAKAVELKLKGLGTAERAFAKQMHTALVTNRKTDEILAGDSGEREMAEARALATTALAGLRRRPPTTSVEEARRTCAMLQERIAELLSKYQIYRQLPTESDAHGVGEAARLAFEEHE